ncbi:MAG: GerW family sporulation protein [Lachnospiraceae bacterium]|nr:GerW family sporulation protein [Lachnospiraceae bacterium]
MAESNFSTTVNSLFQGMENFITTKTVVGEPIRLDDGTVILPLADASFGMGAGAWTGKDKNNDGGGVGGKMQSSAVLVIHDGQSRLINLKYQESTSKIVDMIPDIIDKVKAMFGKADATEEPVSEQASEAGAASEAGESSETAE